MPVLLFVTRYLFIYSCRYWLSSSVLGEHQNILTTLPVDLTHVRCVRAKPTPRDASVHSLARIRTCACENKQTSKDTLPLLTVTNQSWTQYDEAHISNHSGLVPLGLYHSFVGTFVTCISGVGFCSIRQGYDFKSKIAIGTRRCQRKNKLDNRTRLWIIILRRNTQSDICG